MHYLLFLKKYILKKMALQKADNEQSKLFNELKV